MEKVAHAHPARKGLAVWTFPVGVNCALGNLIEERAGLTVQLKQRVRLDGVAPGLLYNYLLARGLCLEDVVSPRQFEDLVAEVFRAEGWDVYQTKQTRDGGKDLVVRRASTTAYLPLSSTIQPIISGQPQAA